MAPVLMFRRRWMLSLGCALLAGFSPGVSGQSFGILRELWENLGGSTSLSELTNAPAYPNNPTSSNTITDLFEAPTDVLEGYGQRLHGYVVAPLTGNYTFWIASDDNGALFLSTDERPSNARLIASVQGWTPPRQWEVEGNQQSAPIALTAGRAYYISALMKEGGGGDNLAVRWRMPDGTDQAPMVATNLLPWGVSFAPPVIARQPEATTTVEGGFATFRVELSSVGPATFLWRRNGSVLNADSAPELAYGPVRLTDDGARFSVLVTNRQGSVVSSEAVLRVTPDVTRPELRAVLNIGTNLLRVTFSEAVSAGTATNPAYYQIAGVTVRSAQVDASGVVVDLALDALRYGQAYTLVVNGVTDRAATPNAIAPGSQIPFTAVEYAPAMVGQPAVAGSVVAVPAGATVRGNGMVGGRSDAFQFAYQSVTGDFDRRVRVASFSPVDPFAPAGLMARGTLASDSAFAGVFTTPAQIGSFLLSRATAGAEAARLGGYPAALPNLWLRLARVGSSFRGYASVDGVAWTELGRTTVSLPTTVYLGFAVGSASDPGAAVVEFRDAGPVTSPQVAAAVPRRAETLGPSSRLTGLVISEIMVHPRERADGRNTEFVELYNADLIDRDLSGHRLSGSIGYSFPDGYVLPAGGFAVVARVPAEFSAVSGLSGVLGPFEGADGLPNGLGLVQLRNAADAVLLEVGYDFAHRWPVAADGAGASLVLARPSFGEGDPRAWAPSRNAGGSPGTFEPVEADPLDDLVLNEVLAHTDLPQVDVVELHNRGGSRLDLGGCILTDTPATNRFVIPAGTTLGPGGFLAFDERQLGFRLDAAGETVVLLSPGGGRVLDAVRFGPQENGVAYGRHPDGAPDWRRLQAFTPAAENAPPRISEVVINEILYAPISGADDDEFIELHNRADRPVALAGWSLSDGVSFRFPAGATLGAGGYLVVARDPSRLLTNNPALPRDRVFGPYQGSLSNGGERIALAFPDWIVATNLAGVVVTNRIDIDVDEVTYGTGGAWGRWSDGLGSSLELVDPDSDHLRASNWADSDESAKADWTVIEFTGLVDNVAGGSSTDRIHLLAQGPGEYLIDDVQVLAADGSSRLANGDFSSGLTGWTRQGNHRASALSETGGTGGGPALRVVTTGRGDTAVNRVRASLSRALPTGAEATLRARVRWLAGWPEFLLRTRGNGIEAYGRLNTPRSPGTPGMRNSRAVSNAGPAIFDVAHTPVVPRANESVVVTARVSDPDGIGGVTLRHRLDPGTTLTSVAMRDDGTGGDVRAGDGVYSATLAGRSGGSLVAFRIEATDAAGSPVASVHPPDAPATEALIRWGEERQFGNLGVYRFWQRKADYDRLRSREPLANDNLPCTFVYGDERVIHGAGMRGKGSPWHGGSVGADYLFEMPEGDRLLGARDLAVVTVGNLGNDASAQREQAAYWIGEQMGVPILHRRHVRFYENGGFKGLYEDTEEPNGLYVDRRWPEGEDGDLFKVEDWFEFNDTGDQFISQQDATLQRFTSGGQLKQARYRWSWRKRAVADSANDYSEFLTLVTAMNIQGSTYETQVANLVDVDAWLRLIALQHLVGNWDAYGYNRGKNAYIYLPRGDRWKMIPWDIDFVLGLSSDGPTGDVFGTNDPTISRLWNTPVFRRMYWRAFQDAVNGPLREEAIGPVLDGRYAALVANGFTLEGTSGIKSYVRQRRADLERRIASVDAGALEITTNGGADFSTAVGYITLTGTAPIAAAEIRVNGAPFPVTWPNLTTWSLAVPLGAATNRLTIVGHDRLGRAIPGLTDTVTIRYTGTPALPEGSVVFNEIQFDAAPGRAEFIEFHNASATAAFDLSGWQVDGAGFVFPGGTLLAPGGFAVITSDIEAFRAEHGASVTVAGVFAGSLQNNGERLKLVRPGATAGSQQVVDEVRYGATDPWPVPSRGLGSSLQLVDPRLDRRRPANWDAVAPTDSNRSTPGRVNAVRQTLEAFPNLWINEVLPENAASDGLRDGAGDLDPWVEIYNAGTNAVSLGGLMLSSNPANLGAWSFPAEASIGAGQFLVVWCDGEPAESRPGEWHTSFRLSPGSGSVVLSRLQLGKAAALDVVDYEVLPASMAWGSYPDGEPYARGLFHQPTPGAANRKDAPVPLVFINEWMASNRGIVLDPADQDADDWFELYNAGSTPADLSAFTLSDDLADREQYRIPNGTVIAPGGFLLVWADEEMGQTVPGALHVNFRLSAAGDALGLFTPDGTPVDALSFGIQQDNVSQGRFPDGGQEPFVSMEAPTPGAPNSVATANRAPVLAAIPAMIRNEGETVTFRAVATDPDPGQTIRYSLVGAPAGSTLDAVTGEFRWVTAEPDGPGTVTFSVRATDDGAPPRSATTAVSVTVNEVNQPPVLDPVADLQAAENSLISFALVARDADLPVQRLVYSVDPGAPAGVSVDPVTGVFTWTPSESQGPGSYPVTVRVTDVAEPPGTAARSLTIQVTEADDAPVFDAVALQTVDEGTELALVLVARDPDSPPRSVTYTLESGPSGGVLDPATGWFRWTPTEAQGPGSYVATVRADQEGGGPSGRLTFSVVVNEANQPPVVDAVADLDVVEGTLVRVPIVARDEDLPPQRLSYRLESGAPDGAAVDSNTGLFTWAVPRDAGASTNGIAVVVTDQAIGELSTTVRFRVVVRAEPRLVIHEIQYAPAVANTEFVELYNPSATTGWSLAGWRLTGLEFEFGPGTELGPEKYLVVARNLAAFRAAYGPAAAAVGDARLAFPATGPLGVALQRPDSGRWHVVDEVVFRRTAPWPVAANGGGPSLQVMDAAEDNRRVANWAALEGATALEPVTVVTFTNSWRYLQTGPAPADWTGTNFNDAAWPSGRGLLYVEDASLPEPKNTPLTRTEGRMTYYFRTEFPFSGHPEGASLRLNLIVDDGVVLHLNGREVYRLGIDTTPVTDNTPATRTVADAVREGPFSIVVTNLQRGRNVLAAEVHQVNATSSDVVWGAQVEVVEVRREAVTPGYANSVRADLEPFPEVWLSEVLPLNTAGAVDNAGEREPWVELFHGGDQPASLSGWWLTADLARLDAWAFPAGATVQPGEYRLIWADNEPAEQSSDAWHASFRPSHPAGVIALVRSQQGRPAVVDFLEYNVPGADQSYGLLAPEAPLGRGVLPVPTPGAPNAANRPPELAAIPDQRVVAGDLLTVPLSASDPDPGQTLAYHVAAGAPAGLGLDAVGTSVVWRPGAADVGVHPVTVLVTDDGLPPMGAQRGFIITVLESPAQIRITSFVLGPNRVALLSWTSEPGKRYRVETTPSLAAAWSVQSEVLADAVIESAEVPVSLEGGGFYRVLRVD